MSTSRRDTAAARAALARRRQRGIFTPSPTNSSSSNTNALPPQPSSLEGRRPQSLKSKATTKKEELSQQTQGSTAARLTENPARATASSNKDRASEPLPSQMQHALTSINIKTTEPHGSPLRNQNDRAVRFSTSNGTAAIMANETRLDEQPEFIEEPEPIVGDEVVDAKCLRFDSSIIIRSHSNVRSLVTVTKKTRGDAARYLASLNSGLAAEVHNLQLTRDGMGDDIVRYGDIVVFRSKEAQDRTLGVRKMSATEGITYEVGFFRSTVSLADQWTILRGGRVVLVGSSALSQDSKKRGKTAAVRSGDPLLLRNNLTGGLLSLDSLDGDTLTLVTDSYDSDVNRTGNSSDKDPISKIQHHDRLLPSDRETFQIVQSNVPPCPYWVDEESGRMYENGSYLLQPGRNDRHEESKLALFGPPIRDGRKSLQAPVKSGVATQERILLDEVIGSLIGLEGHYILFKNDGEQPCYCLSDPSTCVSFDKSLRNLVNRVLPLSTAFVRVKAFQALHRPGYEYGFVVQAVFESVDEMLQDHLVFAAEMEQLQRQDTAADPMTMNKLNVYVQAPLRRMLVLEHVISSVQERKGGSLLNALHELKTRIFAGDDIAQEVLDVMLQKGSVPYFKMLDAWLESGLIDDPFGEFMIATSETLDAIRGYDGDSWNEMFRIRKEHVLDSCLSAASAQQQILLTGKYWNAVQLCYRTTADLKDSESLLQQNRSETPVSLSGMDAVALATHVHSKYHSASQQLLRLLMDDFQTMETLITLKRYFLLHQGDFLVHLFDAAEEELSKEQKDVSRGRVNQWMNTCIHLTEPNNEDTISVLSSVGAMKPAGPLKAQMIRCSFAPESLIDHLDALHAESGGIDAHEPKTPSRHLYGTTASEITGIEAFSIHFDRIPFPTSLILSQQALSKYQLLFRHLFFSKHVERRLVGIWLDHQMMKKFQSLRRAMGPTYCLRQRMLHFMQNFIYYMMFEVIEPKWLDMENSIRKKSSPETQTVDDIIYVHNKFLDAALTECLLTNRELVRTLTKLMRTCLLFSDQLKRFMEMTKIVSETIPESY